MRYNPVPQGICLRTRRGTLIPNAQPADLTPGDLLQIRDQGLKHPGAKPRTNPLPFYNCHGLVFASRRTRIWDPAVVAQILIEDGFEAIDRDSTLAGDVVIYCDDQGTIEHSAVLLEAPSRDNFYLPLVYGKWGFGKEWIHSLSNCPYAAENIRYYRITK